MDHIAADIVVLQEIARPGAETGTCIWIGDREQQGVAVVVRPPYSVRPFGPPYAGSAQFWPVRVEGPVSFTLIVVCTAAHEKYVQGACQSIDAHASLLGSGECVVIGDFNSNAKWDSQHPAGQNHSALVARLKKLGLESAYHVHFAEAHGQESSPTFFLYGHRERHHHIDYCFIPSRWKASIRLVSVGDFETFQGRSDHRPLLVELDTSSMTDHLSLQDEMQEAAQVMRNACQDEGQADLVLGVLLDSADFAARIAPGAAAVTLYRNGFRLNVGQVEAVVFLGGVLRVNLCALVGTAPADGDDFVPAGYRSLPLPQAAFVGTPERFGELREPLRKAHQQFLTRAALTKSGKPRRGTPFRASHCEGLLQLARHRAVASEP